MHTKNNMSNSMRLKNANYLFWSRSVKACLPLLSWMPPTMKHAYATSLLAAATLLSGCSQLPTRPLIVLDPATMPVLSQPLPSEPYSESVEKSLLRWEKRLQDTSSTSKK